jgi:hypothetical protein
MTAAVAGTRAPLIHRAAVDFDTAQTRAASRTEPLGTTIVEGTLRGLPSRFPCALARCIRRFDPALDATRTSRELALQWATEERKAIEAYSDKRSPPTGAP